MILTLHPYVYVYWKYVMYPNLGPAPEKKYTLKTFMGSYHYLELCEQL